MRLARWIWKWAWCSWRHGKTSAMNYKIGKMVMVSGRCYPRVDIPDGAPGADEWHCIECHPCSEGLRKIGVLK